MSKGRGFAAWFLATLVICIVLVPNFVSAAADRDVRVINTPAQSVPVAVQGTPTVNIGNSPSVSISGTPTVGLDPSANTVQIEGGGRGEPWQITDRGGTGSASEGLLSDMYAVPTGKDLVVTFVTAQARNFGGSPGSGGAPVQATLTSAEGPGIQVFIPLERQGEFDAWQASLMTDVTFPERVFFAASTLGATSGFLRWDWTISGYLVDEPTP